MRAFMPLAFAALAACGGGSTGPAGPVVLEPRPLSFSDDGPAQPEPPERREALLNGLRLDTGVGTLSHDARLARAADGHAEDMVRRGYFSHVAPGGDTVAERVQAEGYRPEVVAEVLARRQPTFAGALGDWEKSDSHRRVLLDPRVEDFGIGLAGPARDRHWVLIVGAE